MRLLLSLLVAFVGAGQIVIRNSGDSDNAPRITTTSIANATEDEACSVTIATQAGVGKAPLVFSVSSGTLPTGASLNTSSGAIAGTCSAAGTFTFTIRVVDALDGTHEQKLSWTIDAAGGACAFPDCFPDASNTGVLSGVSRTTQALPFLSSSHGQLVENLNLTGSGMDFSVAPTHVLITHNNVTFRNVRIENVSQAFYVTGSGFVMEDSEIDSTTNVPDALAIFASGTFRRIKLLGQVEGLRPNSPFSIEDSYGGSYKVAEGPDPHQDAWMQNFSTGVESIHNTVISTVSVSTLITDGGVGTSGTYSQTLMGGNAPWCMDLGGSGVVQNNRITTTVLSTGCTGVFTGTGTGSRCGNRWYDGPNAGQLLSGESACSPPAPAALHHDHGASMRQRAANTVAGRWLTASLWAWLRRMVRVS